MRAFFVQRECPPQRGQVLPFASKARMTRLRGNERGPPFKLICVEVCFDPMQTLDAFARATG